MTQPDISGIVSSGTNEKEVIVLNLILPKTRARLESSYLLSLPLYFLAGPIGGGEDWQRVMAEMLDQKLGDCIIANPYRYRSDHPHYRYQLQGLGEFETQTLWERHYLREAAVGWRAGCILLWLPQESKTKPRNDGNPYAMDTRGEIAEWRTHLAYSPKVRLVVGAEAGFPGLQTIQRNFQAQVGRHFKFCQTMEETVDCAARFA